MEVTQVHVLETKTVWSNIELIESLKTQSKWYISVLDINWRKSTIFSKSQKLRKAEVWIFTESVCDAAFMLCGGLKSVLVISGRKGKTNKCKK